MSGSKILSWIRLNWILLLLLSGVYCFWMFVYRYQLLHQEQFTQFLYTPEFFFSRLLQPGGITDYLGRFMIQFFTNSFVTITLVTATFGVVCWVMRQLVRNTWIDSIPGLWVIPAFGLLGLQTHYDFIFSESLRVVFYFLLLYGYSRLTVFRVRCWVSIFAAPFLMLFLGGGALILFYITLGIYEWREARVGSVWKLWVGWFVLILLLSRVWKWFVFLSEESLYGLLFQPIDLNCKFLPYIVFGVPMLLLLVGSRLCFEKWVSRLRKWVLVGGSFLLIALAVLFLKKTCYYPGTDLFFHLLYSTNKEKWDDALQAAEGYSGNRVGTIVLTNLALAQEGLLAEDLFKYKQIGVKGLLHPHETNYFGGLCAHEVFYRFGVWNEAFHWLFEASVCQSKQLPPWITQRLAELLLRLNKPEAARKYLFYLLRTRKYKTWALEQLRSLPTGKQEEHKHTRDFLIGAYGPFYDLTEMASNDPKNIMIRDYLLCAFLLENQPVDFYAYLEKYYRPYSHVPLPRVYEEALVVVGGLQIDPDVFKKYTISTACRERYQAYVHLYKSISDSDTKKAEKMKKQFGNTLWYYYHFTLN